MTTPFILGNDFAYQYSLSIIRDERKMTRLILGTLGRSMPLWEVFFGSKPPRLKTIQDMHITLAEREVPVLESSAIEADILGPEVLIKNTSDIESYLMDIDLDSSSSLQYTQATSLHVPTQFPHAQSTSGSAPMDDKGIEYLKSTEILKTAPYHIPTASPSEIDVSASPTNSPITDNPMEEKSETASVEDGYNFLDFPFYTNIDYHSCQYGDKSLPMKTDDLWHHYFGEEWEKRKQKLNLAVANLPLASSFHGTPGTNSIPDSEAAIYDSYDKEFYNQCLTLAGSHPHSDCSSPQCQVELPDLTETWDIKESQDLALESLS